MGYSTPSDIHGPSYRLRVSRYDQVASMLIALLILVGAVVTLMLLVWLTAQIFLSQPALPVELVQLGEGEGLLAGGMELEGPIEEEIGLETDLDEPAVEQTLASIAEAVGSELALLDDPTLSEQAQAGRGGGSSGDGRLAGSATGSGAGRLRRWEVRFSKGLTLQSYARQLDFFEIELGVLLPNNRIHYARNLSKARPDTRIGPADQETRYYLTWQRGDLMEADRELLARAGVQSQGRIILKFLTPQWEARLVGLEQRFAAARNQTPETIRKTWFAVVEQTDGYAFVVTDQAYQ